jgi:cyclophilin family peptidyl-prolyl cis-trans isomerase
MGFHVVCPGFVQTGDPAGRGGEGTKETIPAEIKMPFIKGAVAAARKMNNNPKRESHGSQFFIMKWRYPEFNNQYTVFGRVTRGWDVLDKIPLGEKEKNYQIPPDEEVKIITAELENKPEASPAASQGSTEPVSGNPAPK